MKYKTFENKEKNEQINIYYDECSDMNPRDWDNETQIICFHKKYDLGDKTEYTSEMFNNWEELKEQLHKDYDIKEILPLYLYNHSGITISTTPFSCRWDSGQIGFVFITKEQYKNFTEKDAKKILIDQIKTYDNYLTGEIFRFEHIKKTICICKCCNTEHEELLDSCSGFFGSDIETNGIKDHVDFKGFTEVQ